MNYLVSQLGGRFTGSHPSVMEKDLSESALALYHEVFADVDCSRIVDYHVHLVGRDIEKTGCYCHPSMLSGSNAAQRVKAQCFMSAARVSIEQEDSAYVQRLLELNRFGCPSAMRTAGHWKMCALALDYSYTTEGVKSEDLTSLHIPNDYSMQVAQDFPESFIPTCSVHPFRSDAIDELKRCHSNGVRLVKWLPNSQNFSPGDTRCGVFYDAVRELDMVILCHTGDEHSLTAGCIDDSHGNPLHLKLALDRGAKVIMAHCATEGVFVDLDHPENRTKVSGVDLMLRMMRQPEYKDILFGDISAIIGLKRAKHIQTLLQATDIHDRLLYGSDYPVPAINVVSSTKYLWWLGLISWSDIKPLNELYSHNPLVYDYAVKRRMSFNGHQFPKEVFQEHELLQLRKWRGLQQPDPLDCDHSPAACVRAADYQAEAAAAEATAGAAEAADAADIAAFALGKQLK